MKRYPPTPLSQKRWKNKSIGLLGGSFNPPHHGHMHIALAALKKYKFNAIWWLVSPQNPLKEKSTPFQKRLQMTQKFVDHPKMLACDIETHFNIKYTQQTVLKLKKHFSKTQFHWIAGMDNTKSFHHWQGWKTLLADIPFTFMNRPPNGMALKHYPIKMYKGQKNVSYIMTGKTLKISSTEIRKEGFASWLKSAI